MVGLSLTPKKLSGPLTLPAWCGEGKLELDEINEGATFIPSVQHPREGACRKHYYTQIARPFEDLPRVYVHNSCQHNEEVALRNRVLKKHGGKCTPESKAQLIKVARKWGNSLPKPQRMPLDDVPKLYSGGKRALYERGVASLRRIPISKKDSSIEMFPKPEKYNFDKKTRPFSRAILARAMRKHGPRYGILLASYLKPIEHFIYASKSWWKGATHTRFIGKGLSPSQRATLLKHKLDLFGDWVGLSLDCIKFDLHVNEDQLEAEHTVYTTCCPEPEFEQLLSWQLVNFGKTSCGMKFRVKGNRMSGDMNTACGNCTIMCLMIIAKCTELGIEFELYDDGDDCLLFIRQKDLELVMNRLPAMFAELGHELKFEAAPAYKLEQISWCQSSPVLTSVGWTFVRDPIKVMSHAVVSRQWPHLNQRQRYAYLTSVGQCELALNAGVPVLQTFAQAMIRNGKGISDAYVDSLVRKDYHNLKSKRPGAPVSSESRCSFSEAFGIPTPQQLHIERCLEQWNFNCEGVNLAHGNIETASWIWLDETRNRTLTLAGIQNNWVVGCN